jgi:hypothetical protein
MRILPFVFVDGFASTETAARSPDVSITRDEGQCEPMASDAKIRNGTSVSDGRARLLPPRFSRVPPLCSHLQRACVLPATPPRKSAALTRTKRKTILVKSVCLFLSRGMPSVLL